MPIVEDSNHSPWQSGSDPGVNTYIQGRGASVASSNEFFAGRGAVFICPTTHDDGPNTACHCINTTSRPSHHDGAHLP